MEVSLNDQANQSVFAKIVGISQPTVHKHAKRLGLIPGQTYAEWILAYTNQLRTEASGRAHESDSSFIALKKRKAELENIDLTITVGEKLEIFVPTEIALSTIYDLLDFFQQELINVGDNISEKLESKFNIEVDDECISDPIRATAERVASNARELGQSFIGSSGQDDHRKALADSGVGSA